MTDRIRLKIIFIISLLLVSGIALQAQRIDNNALKKQIESYKKDERGPYKDLRWFCPDGTIVLPKERCEGPGGVQRARYKDEVENLAISNHIFLGQILSNTPFDEFLDAGNGYSRLKQYQLEQ